MSPPRDPGAPAAVIDELGRVRVIPVVTLDDADDAVPVARALAEGGLPVVEITLRTSAGLDAIGRVREEVAEVTVGAGSVTSAAQAADAVAAGAEFVVSPGLAAEVVRAANSTATPVLPGIATATELMEAAALGLGVVKVFPAEVVGGPAMIDALGAVWPEMRFVPTGGIGPANAGAYLARPQVLAVGGSWMASRALIADRDWNSIASAAAACTELVEEVP